MSDNMWLAGQVYLQEQNNKELRRVREVNEQMLRHTVQANQQIVKMQQHIAQAQHLSNKIQTEQLKVQLRDEEAKAEQKILRNLVFSCENVADALDTLSPVSLYVAVEQDMQQFIDLIEMAQERLDSIDDKRAAKEQHKRLLTIQSTASQYSNDYSRSLLKQLRALGSIVVQREAELSDPLLSPQIETKEIPSIPFKMALGLTLIGIPLIFFFDAGLRTFPALSMMFIIIVALRWFQESKARQEYSERVALTIEENKAAEVAHQEAMIIYERKVEEYSAKQEALLQLKNEYEEMLDKARIEHTDYFNFLNLLKKFDPSKHAALDAG